MMTFLGDERPSSDQHQCSSNRRPVSTHLQPRASPLLLLLAPPPLRPIDRPSRRRWLSQCSRCIVAIICRIIQSTRTSVRLFVAH